MHRSKFLKCKIVLGVWIFCVPMAIAAKESPLDKAVKALVLDLKKSTDMATLDKQLAEFEKKLPSFRKKNSPQPLGIRIGQIQMGLELIPRGEKISAEKCDSLQNSVLFQLEPTVKAGEKPKQAGVSDTLEILRAYGKCG